MARKGTPGQPVDDNPPRRIIHLPDPAAGLIEHHFQTRTGQVVKIEMDQQHGQVYIYLGAQNRGGLTTDTIMTGRIAVNVDKDSGGFLVGIEIV